MKRRKHVHILFFFLHIPGRINQRTVAPLTALVQNAHKFSTLRAGIVHQDPQHQRCPLYGGSHIGIGKVIIFLNDTKNFFPCCCAYAGILFIDDFGNRGYRNISQSRNIPDIHMTPPSARNRETVFLNIVS